MMGKKRQRPVSPLNIFQSFSDMALLMLTTFIFLFVVLIVTSKIQDQVQLPKLKKEISALQQQLATANQDRARLAKDMDAMANMSVERQMNEALASAGLDKGQGRKDFELFINGLKQIPGSTLHLVVDATGSMHGVANFLIPILRVIVIRSGKHVDAITWFADGRAETYQGTLGEMLDQLMHGAPFVGTNETIGDAFIRAAHNTKAPGAYMLIGDEPSDDRIYFLDIPAPVFTLPIGRDDPMTIWEYQRLADKTGGKMLQLKFQ
jgi:hypothetical protein